MLHATETGISSGRLGPWLVVPLPFFNFSQSRSNVPGANELMNSLMANDFVC